MFVIDSPKPTEHPKRTSEDWMMAIACAEAVSTLRTCDDPEKRYMRVLAALTTELPSSKSSCPRLEVTVYLTMTRATKKTSTQAKPNDVAIMVHAE